MQKNYNFKASQSEQGESDTHKIDVFSVAENYGPYYMCGPDIEPPGRRLLFPLPGLCPSESADWRVGSEAPESRENSN